MLQHEYSLCVPAWEVLLLPSPHVIWGEGSPNFAVPLEINYLVIVLSVHPLLFVMRMEKISPKWTIRGGIQNSQ